MTDSEDTSAGITRRGLLKAGTGTALGVIGLSGSATAHPPQEVRFCGCSRVSVRTTKSYRVLYAEETGDGYSCRFDRATYAAEHRESGWFVAGDDEKIIGVLGGDRQLFWNPNTCAQRALDTLDANDCFGCLDPPCDDRVEYDQLGPHDYAVGGTDSLVRTRNCRPPDQWDEGPEQSISRRDQESPPALGTGLNPPG